MFKLPQKRKEEAQKKDQDEGAALPSFSKQMSVRSKFLTQEIAELNPILPSTCSLEFQDVDDLRKFTLIVKPDEGHWKGGRFVFNISVPMDYNIKPPIVSCLTNIWHPNITEDGKICLSILREYTLDGTGWLPTRTLKDVVWGLNSLFTDLLNFDDPLNTEAADQYARDKYMFEKKVRDYVRRFAQ
jgi:ubiquitin-conjugating enzyme E2 F